MNIVNNIKIKKRKLINWEGKKESLSERAIRYSDSICRITAVRGSVYKVRFGENVGHELNKARPAIVVSSTDFNKKRSGLVVVVPLTENLQYDKDGKVPKYPWHYFLYKKDHDFLRLDSTVECEQIRCINRNRIIKYMGNLDHEEMEKITKKLHSFLG